MQLSLSASVLRNPTRISTRFSNLSLAADPLDRKPKTPSHITIERLKVYPQIHLDEPPTIGPANANAVISSSVIEYL